MQIKGATTILNKRAEFFGKTLEQLIDMLDNGFDDNHNVLVAYEVYKMDQGFYWKGTEGDTWILRQERNINA
jgi:hypothetical protein